MTGTSIDHKTRIEIKKLLLTPQYFWHGAQNPIDFLYELYDLNSLPSLDSRFDDAYGDIKKHLDWNDWEESWVFNDPRFEFMTCPDEELLEFVAQTLNPQVRKDFKARKSMLEKLNNILAPWDYELYETTAEDGVETFKYRNRTIVSDLKLIRDRKTAEPIRLKLEGEGSYAIVHSYIDPNYGTKFAIKRARKDLNDKELRRFKQEFDSLKSLRSPYVVEAYRYDEGRNEYVMEFCDQTLEEYIEPRNGKLTFGARKRIALQFLQGINYIHKKGYLHRDLSRRNVLMKIYDDDEVVVKISDFGLVKDPNSDLTQTGTQMKGTHRDPFLDEFGEFGPQNEIYAIGWILQYIFTGRKSLGEGSVPGAERIHQIIEKCTMNKLSQRYESVSEIISDVKVLVLDSAAE
ncbi:protein kinase domain-containing protein [Rhodococcus gordoniae]|uniref:AbiJ-related protein n=1 Tax=Rhodococcus gordoniae TaxID=223392 RepID=UPI0020CD4FA7|nr:protein kinase [Rhodococcus gordoniae]UTT51236.1 protein kinase [Rhodococcus gordoniae]